MRIRQYGADALLVELGEPADTGRVHDLASWARARLPATEVVPGAATLLVSGVADLAGAEELLREATAARSSADLPEGLAAKVELPVRYDGEDLDDVARQWGMTRAEAVATHTSLDHVVAFCGFAPGFAYLAGLPAELAVARRATPRPRVPAGSVAVADVWTGVYPAASPGGWRLLGRTDARLWEPERESPALLPPGTRVRLVEVR